MALSLRPLWFSPGSAIEILANHWGHWVSTIRRDGLRCRHYQEVRYETLVREPRAALMRICAFLDLDYHPAMMQYHRRSTVRLTETRLAIVSTAACWSPRGTAKTSVVSRYAAGVGGTLLREVENIIGDHGADVLRTEYLVPVPNGGREHLFASEPPYYQSHGAQRVAEGHYRQVIRHVEHVLPLARALRGLADHEA